MLRHATTLVLGLCLATASASAAIYTDRAAFDTATGAIDYDFADATVGAIYNDFDFNSEGYVYAQTASRLGLVITDRYNSVSGKSLAAKQVVGPLDNADYFHGGESFGVNLYGFTSAVGVLLNVNLPFELDGSTSNDDGQNLSTGGVADFTRYDSGTFVFLGIVNPHRFTQANFTSTLPAGSFNIVAIDVAGYNGAIPEPATWALLLAGFGAVGAAARRRRAVV